MTHEDSRYKAMVEGLFARHPSVQNTGFGAGAYKPGLEAMDAFAESLGHPETRFRCIHVAGTNGKGSVSSMLAASLASTGLRTGLYTSPHLVDFRERIKLIDSDGAHMISREDVMEFIEGHDLGQLSFFEITTGLAFWWFERQGVDIAVIEVGLGGRLDSTNIITPELSVVTSIGLDHCALLGNTRAEIAAEKAGIFKPGVPALVASRDEETAGVFESIAAEVHCPLFFADEMYELPDASGLDLQGPCQAVNLRTVFAALDLLGEDIDMEVLEHTAQATGFHGRWEKLLESPETICDIGHNPAALEINFGRLEQMGRPMFIVYGVMADKDLDGIAPLMPAAARYYLAAPSTERSLPVEALRSRLAGLRPDLEARAESSVAQAVKAAVGDASEVKDSIVYIGGSTFVVSEAVLYLKTGL